MDITCSPHRSSGGTLHLPSPTHPHRYRIDAFPSIKQLRRSLSRSPSKPSRFSLPAHSPESPRSPISPLALNRAFTPRAMVDRQHQTQPVSPLGPQHHTPIAPCSTTKRPKFTLRRTQPLRSSPRARANQNSVTPMRRALIESSNQANTHPVRRTCEDERADAYSQLTGKFEMEQKTPASQYLGFDDGPIKFGFSKSMTENVYPNEPPVKSSPLKRSDGIMNLDQASLGSPNPKRRSVHGASFGADFNVFDHGPNAAQSHTDVGASEETDREPLSFSSPAPKKSFTLRKSTSLRKATLQNRYPMPRANPETIATSAASASSGEFQLPLEAASKARQRMSLDSALGLGRTSADPLFRPNAFSQSLNGRPVSFAPQPHPLSKTLPNIPSSSNLIDDAVTSAVPPTPAPAQKTVLSFTPAKAEPNPFYRSLGPDAPRPMALRSKIAEGSPFETPMGTKIERGPAPFMSTGLISKQNRVVSPPGAHPVMPDTPSKLKRQSFPPMTGTPKRDSVAKTTRRPLPEFGTPSSPFNFHVSKSSAKSFGKGVPLFGSFSGKDSSRRRASFASIDGEDWQHSPSRHRESPSLPTDSQCSSNDELPPTPTKPSSRDNSLRSTLLGRRTSIAPDTFTAPSTALDVPSPTLAKVSPAPCKDNLSPHTPQESFTPPDPSSLSISNNRRGSVSFGSSINFNASFPPATPSAHRESTFFFGASAMAANTSTQEDVDTALTSRFGSVISCGTGEFSQVYRTEKPFTSSFSRGSNKVFAVKKSKKPYLGARDRARKMQEVQVLQALKGHDHVIEYFDHWESKDHLYIQTEFCENGNLDDFLTQAGYKGRLDDFRIWKILLEVAAGVKHIHNSGFIHLDLKPANVFVDWEGVLKIGDFGLAVPYSGTASIDGEGDRQYMAPELLQGQFGKPADVFALGMIMVEIAGNTVLPDNGDSWQRLRAGDLSVVPNGSLTFSSASTMARDDSGNIIDNSVNLDSYESLFGSEHNDDDLSFIRDVHPTPRQEELVTPPNFMVDSEDEDSLDRRVQLMISPNPDHRPSIDQVCLFGGCMWVERRRRAGATVYEGNFGPADEVFFSHGQDVDMIDAN